MNKLQQPALLVALQEAVIALLPETGPDPLILYDTPALGHERLAWVDQNYLRDDIHG